MLQDTQPSHHFSSGGGNLGLRSSISRMTNHPALLGIKALPYLDFDSKTVSEKPE